MTRLDWLRISLLAGLTGCSIDPGTEGDDGNTTTTMGTGATDSTTTAETGEDEVCTNGCEGAVEIAEGIVQCPDGRINRIGGGTFDPTINAESCAGTETDLNCTTDADCNGTHVKCITGIRYDDFGETTYCGCATACASDSDCEDGSVCVPPHVLDGRPDWPTCLAAPCATGSDCGECGECGLGAYDDGCGYTHAAACRSTTDVCGGDDDCEAGATCFPLDDSGWNCHYSGCAIGRPLLVAAGARTAAPRRRHDWVAAGFDGLGFDELCADSQLAAHWAEIAALEHASVASFARFGMQLLALGAPPRLLRACKQAALDEIEHARLAYGLASAYGCAGLGPDRLSLSGVAITSSWREVVEALIVEACVGETLGVAEATTAAEHARSPIVREVLQRIATDELRHAQLAWQCLAWLLEQAGREDRAWALALLDRAIAAVATTDDIGGLDRAPDGVLGGTRRARVHRDARAQVLEPLAQKFATNSMPSKLSVQVPMPGSA